MGYFGIHTNKSASKKTHIKTIKHKGQIFLTLI